MKMHYGTNGTSQKMVLQASATTCMDLDVAKWNTISQQIPCMDLVVPFASLLVLAKEKRIHLWHDKLAHIQDGGSFLRLTWGSWITVGFSLVVMKLCWYCLRASNFGRAGLVMS